LLVAAAAKRARALRDEGKPLLENPKSHKFVGIAMEEIYHDLVKIEQGK